MPPKASEALKAACWYTVSQIVIEEEVALGMPASEHFVGALAELVFSQALSLGKDLESFAKHANRLTVGVEDVKLVARRNTSLYELLSSEANKHGLALDALKVKAPRARAKPTAAKKAPAVKKETRGTKGKGKAKAVVDDDDDEDEASAEAGESEMDSDDDPRPKKRPKPAGKQVADMKKK